eukprot:gnl/MRDRNA2_/MRDRNA2_85393_c0_seq2.p1 gnl/MRDRNA2_/MRDRNA2_85393_c0~~gnl/MRDRNA2_/MRDRNA2_85393_c0_seq2.p1  ORF type:complete len:248 (-),score=36.60 gnl/MRDRNA2_/MRDRNA2_85393_c0_seq2:241-906(-)
MSASSPSNENMHPTPRAHDDSPRTKNQLESSIKVPHQNSCPRCKVPVESDDASCWCFDLYCMHCYSLAIFCECKNPAYRKESCDTCDHSVAVVGYALEDLEEKGFKYGHEEIEDLGATPAQCTACGEGYLRQRFCFLEHRDLCGHCHKVDNQDDIHRCSSKSCCGDEEGMFHTSCMVCVKEETYQCFACRDADIPLESEDSEDEEADSTSHCSGECGTEGG